MSIRFFNPPVALLSKGTKEGVEIGGSLSVLAMDQSHNIHTVKTIFSELSWGEFWKDEDIRDQIETITVKHEDNATLWDPDELVLRLVDSFRLIKEKGWIFFGIVDLEVNSFQDEMLIEGLDYKYVERLMEQHKLVRDLEKFPTILEDVSSSENSESSTSKNSSEINRYVAAKFNGSGFNFFHYAENNDLFEIFNKLKPLSGSATGIVCTSQGAANFYILSENIHLLKANSEYRIDTQTLEIALDMMNKSVIFPISWFKINIGLASLRTLDAWSQIKGNKDLKKELVNYFSYVNSDLKRAHEIKLKKRRESTQNQDIEVKSLSKEEIDNDMNSIKSILQLDGLGLFKKKE